MHFCGEDSECFVCTYIARALMEFGLGEWGTLYTLTLHFISLSNLAVRMKKRKKKKMRKHVWGGPFLHGYGSLDMHY